MSSAPTLPDDAHALLSRMRHGSVLVLTGAGVSAESGIPTFRGTEGYWTEGHANYQPMELATHAAFRERPDTVWAWYLHRRSVCRGAAPNAAHLALARLERELGARMLLVTQNVDGLHLRAGSSLGRTYQIHGNIDFHRCARECDARLHPIPDDVDLDWPKGRAMDASTRAKLVCPSCGGRSRPHVLWFDEAYDEPRFRFESTRRAASAMDLLVVVGTTGATNLPIQVGSLFASRNAPILVLNPEENPFSEMAAVRTGVFVRGTAGALLPAIVDAIVAG
jgi:NAD-dependent deacetylase